jgi:hypothetical protein
MTRDLLGGVLFTLTYFCALHPIATTHPTCVFSFVGRSYTHSWSCFECVICFFVIIGGVWSIRIFNAIDEMCCSICSRLEGSISFPLGFLTFEFNLRILGVQVSFLPFVESFVLKVL